MRYYTKEWYTLLQQVGLSELFEPVLDKDYTDEEIEALYQDMMEKQVQEEHDLYDEPPFVLTEEDEIDPEDFDPKDYFVGIIDEDGEIEVRNPESYEEFLEFQKREMEEMLFDYENREPFDEEEARAEFAEDYQDNLEEPDEDIPQWIMDTVDPRLIAMWVLPESAYRRLAEEDAEMQERFDELDDAADEAMEDFYESITSDELADLIDDLEEMTGDYVVAYIEAGDEIELSFSGWDEDGEEVRRSIFMNDAEILEKEPLDLQVETDEDGDTISNCDLVESEFYLEDDMFELHFLFDNEDEGLKYLTVRCGEITVEQRLASDL